MPEALELGDSRESSFGAFTCRSMTKQSLLQTSSWSRTFWVSTRFVTAAQVGRYSLNITRAVVSTASRSGILAQTADGYNRPLISGTSGTSSEKIAHGLPCEHATRCAISTRIWLITVHHQSAPHSTGFLS